VINNIDTNKKSLDKPYIDFYIENFNPYSVHVKNDTTEVCVKITGVNETVARHFADHTVILDSAYSVLRSDGNTCMPDQSLYKEKVSTIHFILSSNKVKKINLTDTIYLYYKLHYMDSGKSYEDDFQIILKIVRSTQEVTKLDYSQYSTIKNVLTEKGLWN
jgi:hypothetical protein